MLEKIKANRQLLFAMSMAASWAWGTSLIVGMEIAQTRGFLPFLIWGIANSLALPFFGWIAFRLPNFQQIVESKVVLVFTTIVQVFCIWIQMNAIYQYLGVAGVSDIACKVVAIGTALVFLVLMARNGLMRAVLTDNPLWYGVYALVFAAAVVAIIMGTPMNEITILANKSDISWALYTACVLLSGPIMGIPFWQLAHKVKEENNMNAFNIAGGLFAIYLAFVFLLAQFQFNQVMTWILVAIVFLVAVSSLNSAIVAVQKIAGEKVGVAVAGVTICSWPVVIPMGVMGLWLTMGSMRLWVALACIVLSVAIWIWKHYDVKDDNFDA